MLIVSKGSGLMSVDVHVAHGEREQPLVLELLRRVRLLQQLHCLLRVLLLLGQVHDARGQRGGLGLEVPLHLALDLLERLELVGHPARLRLGEVPSRFRPIRS